jgi:amidophosphoribosyltransferase
MDPLTPMITTNPFDDDKLREECGIFGVSGADTASAIVALGLHALQHRGQEAAGITSWDGHDFHTHRAMGHVAGNFDRDEVIRGLPGGSACGHVRYSTTGETSLRNVQPLYAELNSGGFAVAHNGNISNAMKVRRELIRRGSIFQSTSDTEVIIHLVATSSYRTLLDKFIDALKQVEGAYSLIVMTPEGMIACRDPLGIRPLVMGKLGDTIMFASETVAFDVVGAEYIRSIDPGELVIVTNSGEIRSHRPFGDSASAPVHFRACLFQPPRFDRRRQQRLFGAQGDRRAAGARESGRGGLCHPGAGLAACPPPSAMRRSRASRSNWASSGRTISAAPSSSRAIKVRHLGVKLKHNANRALIDGKKHRADRRFSIVRGTTSLKIVQMMREAGAKEVHMRIASSTDQA